MGLFEEILCVCGGGGAAEMAQQLRTLAELPDSPEFND